MLTSRFTRILLLAYSGIFLMPQPCPAQILSPKRGFGDVNAGYNNLQAVGASWYYTWGSGTGTPGKYEANHYPMFWNGPSQTKINEVLAREPVYILGFNEPERSDQANMSVATAINSWTTISNSTKSYNTANGTSIKLISPAVSDTGGATGGQAWLSNFMNQATADGLKVDAVAFHWYGASTPTNPAASANSFLSRVDSYHNAYDLPVLITEFAIHDWGGNYTDAQIIEANRQFLDIVIPGLEARSYVQGYAWYNWFTDSKLYSGSPPTPTSMAYTYIGSVSAGKTENIGGVDLGEHAAYLTGGTLTMTGTTPGTVNYISALANTSTISGTLDWGLAGSTNWLHIEPDAVLIKNGTNKITISDGAVTNAGILQITNGILQLGVNVTGAGSINITSTGDATGSTARLELTGDITIPQRIIYAQRNDPAGSVGIRNISGNNTLSGPITITSGGNQARFRCDEGLLTLSGPISSDSTSPRNLYFQGVGIGVVSGVISDNSVNAAGKLNLTKEGTGTWTLSGNNTYSGVTTLSAGTLKLGNAGALGTGPLTILGGNLDSSVANLVNTNNNPQNWNADFTFVGTQSLHLGSGAVTLNANRQVTVTANSLTVGGVISGAFGLTKTGPGNLTFSGANIYSGTTTINAGAMVIGNGGALGGTANGTVVAAGATLGALTNVTVSGEALSLSGTGALNGALYVGGNKTLTWDGPITLTGNTKVHADGGSSFVFTPNATVDLGSYSLNFDTGNGANSSFAGMISGVGGSLTKTLGTSVKLTLTGANTYTGGTTISAGTLQVGTGGTVGTGAVTNNASFDVARAGLTTAAISGTGTTTVTAAGATLTANHVRQAGLTIGAGNKVTIAANGGDSGVSRVTNLSINATGQLDLNNNDLIVDNGNLAAVTLLLKTGLDITGAYGGGPGITSTTFATNPLTNTVLGVATNAELGYATFSGQAVDANDVLIKYTYYGDADLNGVVGTATDFDLYITGLTSGGSLGGWLYGDFDYNGTVDSVTDFDLYITGLTSQSGALLTTGPSPSQAVPEPGTMVLGGLALLGFAGVKLRRKKT